MFAAVGGADYGERPVQQAAAAAATRVVIVAVAHARRRPGYWGEVPGLGPQRRTRGSGSVQSILSSPGGDNVRPHGNIAYVLDSGNHRVQVWSLSGGLGGGGNSGGTDPTETAECKKGGWEAFGFKNQGQCVRFVQTGKDSR